MSIGNGYGTEKKDGTIVNGKVPLAPSSDADRC